MKFAALATAFLTYTTAIKLEQVPQEQTLIQAFAEEEGDFGFPMKLDELFKAVDANGDGALTMKEICGAIRKFAKEHDIKLPKGWRKEVHGVFKHVDENHDGKVTMTEIKAAIFDAVDGNNDGEWSLKELKGAIKALAEHMDAKLKKGW